MSFIQAIFTVDQRQPLAAAIIVELGNVKGALVQHIAAGSCRVVIAGSDKLVDVLKARIIAGVTHHRLTFFCRGKDHTFMAKAAHGSALFRVAFRRKGVDLNHPAEADRLVTVILSSV